MGSAMKPITTRGAEELLGLLRERAQQVEESLPPELRAGGPGGTLRLVITDALVQALALEPAAHAERVAQTRRRELLAQTRAKTGG